MFIGGGVYAATTTDPSVDPSPSISASPTTSAAATEQSEPSATATESAVATTQPPVESVEKPEPTASAAPSTTAAEPTDDVQKELEPAPTVETSTAAPKLAKKPSSSPAVESEVAESEEADDDSATAPKDVAQIAAVIGGFEIDGNLDVDGTGNKDWYNVPYGYSHDQYDDGTQIGGAEDDPDGWYWQENSASGKTDLGEIFTYDEVFAGEQYFYLGLSRDAGNGTTSMAIELNQIRSTDDSIVPIRTDGDLLLNVEQGGNKEFKLISVQTWEDDGWGAATTPTGAVTGESNDASIDGYPERTFLESSFNLSKLNQEATCVRSSFTEISIRTRSSNPTNTELEDWLRAPINIPPRCADLSIEKKNEAGELVPGATFKITDKATGDEFLTVTDGGAGDVDGEANGIIEFLFDDFNDIDYLIVTETKAPEGYLLPAPGDRSKKVGPLEPYESYSVSFVDPQPYKPLTVEKTAKGSYSVDYTWDIEKKVALDGQDVDGDTINTTGDTAVDFDYTVEVSQKARTVSDVVVTGEITVNNPNSRSMVATISDTLDDGTICKIEAKDEDPDAEGLQVVVGAGDTVLSYKCTLDGEPAELSGSNEVVVTWDLGDYPQTQEQLDDPKKAGTAQAEADADFTYTVTEANKSITVEDTQHVWDPAWKITWGQDEDGVYTQTYTLAHQVETPGTCQTFDNTASVVEIKDLEDSTSVTLCSGADLSVEKNVVLDLDRNFPWEIEKNLISDQPLEFDKDGKVTAKYEVIVTAGEPQDSGWSMNGQITVTNPNTWQDVETTISDQVNVGGGAVCTIAGDDANLEVDGFQAVIPRATGEGETSVVFDYNCTFASQPTSYDGVNTSTVAWDAAAASTDNGQATGTAEFTEADWGVEKTNETVTVTDDHFDFGTTDEPEWTITYEEGMEPQKRSYEITWTYQESEDLCNTFVNTAFLAGDDEKIIDQDDAEVQGCLPADLDVQKTSNPESGTYVAPGDTVNYTLTFTNDGGVPAEVKYVDHLADILDDASFIEGSLTVNGDGLSASKSGDQILITGELSPQSKATVTYSVTIKTKEFGNGTAVNFLIPKGEEPPQECDPEVTECTEHPILGAVNWSKIDVNRVPLDGSVWTLTGPGTDQDAQAIEVEDCVAETAEECAGEDEDPKAGQFTITGLQWGDYTLQETKAPAGYVIDEEIREFTIGDGDLIYSFDPIENDQQDVPTLPLTGGTGTHIFLIGGSIIVILSLALFGMRRFKGAKA